MEEKKEQKEEKGLISLDEHNAGAWEELPGNSPRLNGIACPVCGTELFDSCPMMTLTSHPAKKDIHCNTCNYHGFRLA